MRKSTTALSFCVTLTAILAAPSVRSPENVGSGKNLAIYDDQNLQSVIVLNRLSTFRTRNWFEDLINSQLGMSAKEFLERIDDTFKRVNINVNGGVTELNTVLNNASPEVRAKIIQLRDQSLNRVSQVVQAFLADLGLVLPAISTTGPQGSVADTIYALLRKTLEEFVKNVGRAMEDCLNILIETMEAFRDLSTEARPEVGQALIRISDNYWYQGLRALQPMIDHIRSLTDFRAAAKLQGPQVQSQDLLDNAVSSILGIDVEIAALEANLALLEIDAIVDATRNELYEAVSTGADNQVRTKVMDIFDSAIHDVIRDVKPISTSLLEFQGSDRRDKSFVFDLVSSLLGVGVNGFKDYLKEAVPRVSDKVKVAASRILSASVEGGDETSIKVWQIVKDAMSSGEEALLPLLEVLRPLLNDNENSASLIHLLASQKKEEWDWANENGLEFNRDALIASVSNILGFNITLAPQTLKWSLERLDDLMDISLEELDSLLSMADGKQEMYTLKHEILDILSQALTNIHITLQPMLDVMLPFLPDKRRSNKEIALDIYSAINGVSSEAFVDYCKVVAERIPQITDAAQVKIRAVAAKGDPIVQAKIEALLAKMDTLTKLYISPFLGILRPIITPLVK